MSGATAARSSRPTSDGQDYLKTEIAERKPERVTQSRQTSLYFIDNINVTESSSAKPGARDPAEFFDFAVYSLPEDTGSKADTPDLVQASSSDRSQSRIRILWQAIDGCDSELVGQLEVGPADVAIRSAVRDRATTDASGCWGHVSHNVWS